MTEQHCLVNGRPDRDVDSADRGLAYGHGVFETLRLSGGRIPLWSRHWRRLQNGLRVLGIPLDPQRLEHDLTAALEAFPGEGGLKLTVTAGSGQRGYRPAGALAPTIICQWFDAPRPPSAMELQLCRYRLPRNPVLAGLKHLNRLDQVLAARELEGDCQALLRDSEGLVIEALSHNLFALRSGEWLTPVLSRCGVRGVMRDLLLEEIMPLADAGAREVDMGVEDLLDSEEVFACNAVAGIVPVTAVRERREWRDHPRCRHLSKLLGELYSCFEA